MAAMLDVEAEVAIAPDRHRLGTNALALRRAAQFTFAFGEASFARHRTAAPWSAVIERPGLRFDVDTPADLQAARLAGFAPSLPSAS